MLILVSEWSFRGGAASLIAGLLADVAAHVAGWSWSEGPIHAGILSGMTVLFIGVLLRGTGTSTDRKERIDAHW